MGEKPKADSTVMDIEQPLQKLVDRLNVSNACEVGVHTPENSKILPLALRGTPCIFVEPDEDAFAQLQDAVGHLENVRLISSAISSESGSVTLVNAGPSTYVKGLRSPAVVNDGLIEESASIQRVACITFDEIDDGSIDYLRVDTEGSEWCVIENLVSRPRLIVLELFGKRYINPYKRQIRSWLSTEGYMPILMDNTDVVFAKKGEVTRSWLDGTRYRYRLGRVYLRIVGKRSVAYVLSLSAKLRHRPS